MAKTYVLEIEDITVMSNFPFDVTEGRYFVASVKSQLAAGMAVRSITATLLDSGQVSLGWVERPPKFERIRRITGYLTGTTDRWGSAKQKELGDRVKHTRV